MNYKKLYISYKKDGEVEHVQNFKETGTDNMVENVQMSSEKPTVLPSPLQRSDL